MIAETQRQDHRAFWLVALVLLVLTRVPVSARYLSIDNVNLAFSLENFDPRIHQPQPPGYPFFVGLARIVNVLFRDAEVTFLVIAVLASGLCLPIVFALGRRMFSPWVGKAAAFLLLLNPVFWFAGLDGPLRPHLALFSVLTAYCSWRCWNGEKPYLFWGACALAVGSGFRPDLLVYLFPVWIVSAWVGTRSPVAVAKGLALMAGIIAIWIAALTFAAGGPRALYRLTLEYLIEQSEVESVLLGAADRAWLRPLSRLVIWNGIAVIGWLWAVPSFLRSKDRIAIWSPHGVFLLVWLVPGLILQAVVHIAAPGHTLFSIPALCIIGAYVIGAVCRSLEKRETALTLVLIFGVMLFLNFFPLPQPASSQATGLERVRNVLSYGTFETSISQIRWLDEIARVSLKEIRELTLPDRPTIVVSSDVHDQQWFMNWRIGRYYLPEYDFWVVAEQKNPKLVYHVKRERITASPNRLRVPVPQGGRVLWLLEHNKAFHRELSKVQPLKGATYILYSDITGNTPPFRVLDFEFVPTDFSGTATSGATGSGIQ